MASTVGSRMATTGNGAAAYAMKQIEPHVVAAYPITPTTTVVEEFSEYVNNGEVRTEFVPTESEHSAMSACIGAAAAGARVITATASQGLALMWEMLYIASGMRLPIVLIVGNRALSAPINIHCDHSDSMGARDSGWIQLYCKNAQEVYDTVIQAVRIGEHPDVRLPVMVCYDGFITTHAITPIDPLEDEKVKAFIGPYKPVYPLLDVHNPVTYGALDLFDYYFEHRRQSIEAMVPALRVIQQVGAEFGGLSGREYGLVEAYRLDDAEVGLVAMSSAASTAEVAVDQLREQGEPVGLLRLRAYRPFPISEVVRRLRHLKAVCVLDRAAAPGAQAGPVGLDVRSALLDLNSRPQITNAVFGLGGRDLGLDDIVSVFRRLQKIAQSGRVEEPLFYLGLRGGNHVD